MQANEMMHILRIFGVVFNVTHIPAQRQCPSKVKTLHLLLNIAVNSQQHFFGQKTEIFPLQLKDSVYSISFLLIVAIRKAKTPVVASYQM